LPSVFNSPPSCTIGGQLAPERELLGKEKFLLHAGRVNRLMLPVELSNGGVLSGLWKAATGGRVEGVLTGVAKLRVPAGELEFPFEFPVKLSRK